MTSSPAADNEAVAAIDAIPLILKMVTDITGRRFAAVARVTEDTWTACAVHDTLGFGLKPGGQSDVNPTLCHEVHQ